ncbi:MAG TPA: TPM domain-containing protein [Fontimonas sp.]
MSTFRRLWSHACTGSLAARRLFPASTLSAIEQAVRACESRHPGEIRFALEPSLPVRAVWRSMTARQRAIEVFADLRVWDTEHNNGVLIYVLLADHAVEIVADRFVARGRVPQTEWDSACRLIEDHFAQGRFEAGSVAGIEAVASILARYPPGPVDVGNELPDAPQRL